MLPTLAESAAKTVFLFCASKGKKCFAIRAGPIVLTRNTVSKELALRARQDFLLESDHFRLQLDLKLKMFKGLKQERARKLDYKLLNDP